MRAARKSPSGRRTEARSYLDINQLELAFINRALHGRGKTRMPGFVSIGNSRRILLLQKRNLEILCRRLRKNWQETALESELQKLLGGEKVASIRFMAPMR